jgi:hypothetical protein
MPSLDRLIETTILADLLRGKEDISRTALAWFERFHLSHRVGVLDRLIDATVFAHHLTLATLNTKHVASFPGLRTERLYESMATRVINMNLREAQDTSGAVSAGQGPVGRRSRRTVRRRQSGMPEPPCHGTRPRAQRPSNPWKTV